MPGDARLAVAARRAGLNRAEMLGLWLTLLDHASRQKPRGQLGNLDSEELSVTLGLERATIEQALAACRDKNLIDADGRLSDWHRTEAASTRRVRAYRARQREKRLAAQKTSPAHAPRSPQSATAPRPASSANRPPLSPHPDDARQIAERRARLSAPAGSPVRELPR